MLALLLLPQAYTWSHSTTACARMSGDDSNIWASSSQGFRWNFDLHVQFPLSNDPDYMEKTVRVEFRRPLVIERIEPQGAATAINGGPNFVEVEVSPAYVGHEYFSIQGFREGGSTDDMLSPTITCGGGADVPPPAPPHAADCDLAPEYGAYPLGGTREAGSDVTLKLARWVPFRNFMLVYYGQEGLAVSKPQGVTIDRNPEVLGESLIGFSFTLDPQGSAGLRCDGHPACIEFEVKPAPHHKPHIICLDSPPPSRPSPPPHAPAPSALPPSPPPPPRIASPPPQGVSVRADAGCALGGSARVLPGATSSSVRIAVTLDSWIDGYLVTLGVDGDGLEVTRAAHAVPYAHGPTIAGATRSFSFALGEEPVEMSAFAVILQTSSFGGLIAMTCSADASPPPPPPIHVVATRTGKAGGVSHAAAYYDDAPGGNEGTVSDASSSYGGSSNAHAPHSTTSHVSAPSVPADEQGGAGGSALIGLILVLATMATIGALVVRPGGMLRTYLDRARGDAIGTPAPRNEFGRAKRSNDHAGETESMVGGPMDDEEDGLPLDQSATRGSGRRAVTSLDDQPALSLSPARDHGMSLDDGDDDLQVGRARPPSHGEI